MPRFYLDAALRAGSSVLLPEDSAHHAVHVLRVQTGDEITLFNGRGGEYGGGRGSKILLSPASELRFSQAIKEGGSDFTIAAGPEAGFNAQEEAAFLDAGFVPVRLGARVLRTETAGIAALAALNALRGDF